MIVRFHAAREHIINGWGPGKGKAGIEKLQFVQARATGELDWQGRRHLEIVVGIESNAELIKIDLAFLVRRTPHLSMERPGACID